MSPLLAAFLKVAGALGFGLNTAAFLAWVERKQSAVIQDRIGANRASIFGWRLLGLFHILADPIKVMAKEDFEPPHALRPWHALAPAISLGFSLLCLAAFPFADGLTPLPMSAGVVFVLAMLSLGVHGVVMAGYSSGSNYSLLGGLRGAAQMISYEVSMLVSLAGALFIYGSLDLSEAARWQATHASWGVPAWGIFLQPLGFILFLTAGAAETKRIPFDLPEGESEIIGYFTEYSGMKFVMFMMNDFIESVVISALAVTLYLGAWHVPGLSLLGLPPIAAAAAGAAAFTLKVMAVLWLLMQLRWTLPRFRFDQLMHLGWKNLLPLSLLNLFVTVWAVYLLQ